MLGEAEAAEVRAIRAGAAVVARPEVKTLRLTGPDRVRFLNGMVSNDVAALGPGQGMIAVKTSNKGRVEAVLRVRVSAGGEALLLDVLEAVAARVLKTLDQFIIMDDCAIADASGAREVVSVFGARAREVLAALGIDPGADLPDHASLVFGDVVVVKDAMLGLAGHELHGPPGLLPRLVAAGATAVSAKALDVARIEAGTPIDGRDLDEETFPMEARLERALNATKGCYVGQEVIARATNFGGVKHILVGLAIDGERVPEEGAPLFLGEARTGELTSVAYSPSVSKIIALGYVRRAEEAAGTQLAVDSPAAGRVTATVVELPFVRG